MQKSSARPREQDKVNLNVSASKLESKSRAFSNSSSRKGFVSYIEAIQKWRDLPEEQQLRRRWDAIPQQVADSMAFEGERVDVEWLKELHAKADPPAGLKPSRGILSYSQLAPLLAERVFAPRNASRRRPTPPSNLTRNSSANSILSLD
jgi:hypothetical protein